MRGAVATATMLVCGFVFGWFPVTGPVSSDMIVSFREMMSKVGRGAAMGAIPRDVVAPCGKESVRWYEEFVHLEVTGVKRLCRARREQRHVAARIRSKIEITPTG